MRFLLALSCCNLVFSMSSGIPASGPFPDGHDQAADGHDLPRPVAAPVLQQQQQQPQTVVSQQQLQPQQQMVPVAAAAMQEKKAPDGHDVGKNLQVTEAAAADGHDANKLPMVENSKSGRSCQSLEFALKLSLVGFYM